MYIRQSIWTLLRGLNYLSVISKAPVIHSPWHLEHLGEIFSLNKVLQPDELPKTKRRGTHETWVSSLCGSNLAPSFLSVASAEAQAHRMLACPIEDSCDGYQLAKNVFAETLKFQTCFVFSVEIKTSFLVELGCSITCMLMNPQLGPSQPSILIS